MWQGEKIQICCRLYVPRPVARVVPHIGDLSHLHRPNLLQHSRPTQRVSEPSAYTALRVSLNTRPTMDLASRRTRLHRSHAHPCHFCLSLSTVATDIPVTIPPCHYCLLHPPRTDDTPSCLITAVPRASTHHCTLSITSVPGQSSKMMLTSQQVHSSRTGESPCSQLATFHMFSLHIQTLSCRERSQRLSMRHYQPMLTLP